MTTSSAIHTEALAKTYVLPFARRRVEALRGVSLDVPAGSIFGLLGPNGAGKTTFVKILLGMTRATTGEARLLGAPVGDFRARRHVGYLPEGGRFPGYHTGRSLLVLHGHLAGLHGPSLAARVDEVLDLVSMRPWQHVRLSRYSKGMVQRLGLAQAMLGRPGLLMLDEPTDGVDPVGRAEIREVLDRLNAGGVTIFLNSHILAEVELFCRHVAILVKGKLQLQGEIAALTRQAGYRLTWQPSAASVAPHPAATAASLRSHDYPDLTSMNAAIDQLRAQGERIVRAEPCQASLEQVFLQAVNNQNAETSDD